MVRIVMLSQAPALPFPASSHLPSLRSSWCKEMLVHWACLLLGRGHVSRPYKQGSLEERIYLGSTLYINNELSTYNDVNHILPTAGDRSPL